MPLTPLIITFLSLTEIYCIAWLISYAADLMADRADKRRAIYRAKAYREVRERRIKTRNRDRLWDELGK